MKKRAWTIDELVEKTGFSRRTIRYYVQEGLVPPPAGRGRGGFYYDSHLAVLEKIRSLQAAGHRLAAIRRLLAAGPAAAAPVADIPPVARSPLARYRLAPGVDLLVERAAEEADPEKIRTIARLARAILAEGEPV